MIVGMLDSGVDVARSEIKNAIFVNENEIADNGIDDDNNGYIDDVNGWDFYNDTNQVFSKDLHDHHGTFLAGIIAAKHDDAGIFGIAPDVKILPLKFMQGTQGQISDAISAIEYASKMGVSIINCSWDNMAYSEEMKNTIERHSNILFVCSAGKALEDIAEKPVYPACYDLPNIVTVAAVDNQLTFYSYTGFGEPVDVAAPGENIYGIMPGGELGYASGTSMAVAHVTGIAALVKSDNPELSAAQIAEVLKKSHQNTFQQPQIQNLGGIIDAHLCLKNAG